MTNFARARPRPGAKLTLTKSLRPSLRLASFDKDFQNLKVESLLASDLGHVFADGDQLQQVFLISFSTPAMPCRMVESFISKTLQEKGDVIVEISDSGPGIDAYAASQIFDPFFTNEGRGKGTGPAGGLLRHRDSPRRKNPVRFKRFGRR